MAPYTRLPQRFNFAGLSLLPSDALLAGKLPFVKNIRSYEEGTIQPRYGLTKKTNPALSGAVETIARLNDTTPTASVPALRFVKTADGNLFAAAPSAANYGAAADSGYSTNPITTVVTTPQFSPQPWLYIGDSTRQRKCNVNGQVYPIGIAPPTTAPAVTYGAPGVTVISLLDTAGVLAAVNPGITTAPANITRVNTTISDIVYDSGNTGYASIGATAMTNIGVGSLLVLAAAETVLVTDLLYAIATTTISQILYDAGTSGLCTIQPTASLGFGQLDGPTLTPYQDRFDQTGAAITPQPTISRSRPIDFPVNALIKIGAGGTLETVRVQSVAVGPDGIQSFRCFATNTHAAGEALAGERGFRAYTVGTRASTNTITEAAVQNVITPTSTAAAVGGISLTGGGYAVDMSVVGARATTVDDDLHVAIHVDLLSYVQEVRLMLDVNPAALGGSDFLQNYYQYAWRANDIISAISTSVTVATPTVQDARQGAVIQNQVDQPFGQDMPFGQSSDPTAPNYNPYGPPEPAGTPSYAEQFTVPDSTSATAINATSAQLALGNSQWIELKCKVSDLTRVGTAYTQTLANVTGLKVQVTIAGYAGAVTVQYCAAWIQGGYGPDTHETLTPYVYCTRWRSSLTGATSNPSPASRGGVMPRRQRVLVSPPTSADPQADLIDHFRLGGLLTKWQYTGTTPIASPGFSDDNADNNIDGGEGLRFDLFQPWPTVGQPKAGTGTIAGTALKRTGGDTFDTNWAPGTTITVNGFVTTLYASPTSTTLLHLTTNCGGATGVTWSVQEPTIQAQVLPSLWGGPVNGVVFLFACGDPTDPGSVHWTHGNNPDGTSDANWLSVTSATEPLINGFVYDGVPFVFSSDDLYRLEPTFGEINTFRAVKTACGRGLWSRWFFCVGPRGVYFGAKDGIYFSAWGAPAVCISDPDLRVLFPNEGNAGSNTNSINAPDFATPVALKLTYVGGYIYFDYHVAAGGYRTLMYEEGEGDQAGRWYYDEYAAEGIQARAWEPGSAVNDQILGGVNGNLYQYDSAAIIDNATQLAWGFDTPWATGGDLRSMKQFGDAVVDVSPALSVGGLTITPVYNYGQSTLTPVVIGVAGASRVLAVIDWSSGGGVLSVNAGLQIRGTLTNTDTGRPTVFGWEPSFVHKAENIAYRGTDWDDLGYPGAKFIQGMVLRANTYNVSKAVQVQYEGGALGVALALIHNGEVQYAYPIDSNGWTPFVAELVRIIGVDANPWNLLDVRWIWEPAPEAATQWQTQETTFDFPGYLSVRDVNIAYMANCPVTLTVWHENNSAVYTLPTTSSVYSRYYLPLQAAKGSWVRFQLTATSPFRLFAKDSSVRVQAWGMPGGYQVVNPFGGPSRQVGALV